MVNLVLTLSLLMMAFHRYMLGHPQGQLCPVYVYGTDSKSR